MYRDPGKHPAIGSAKVRSVTRDQRIASQAHRGSKHRTVFFRQPAY